jgi:hypothetical protein
VNHGNINRFWERFLQYYREVEELDEEECSKPYNLHYIAERLGLNIGKAPDYVSIPLLSRLPAPLRRRSLYVLRIGQYHSRNAEFIVCRSYEDYSDSAFILKDIVGNARPYSLDDPLLKKMMNLRGESLASTLAYKIIGEVDDVSYIIPQYRGGNVEFEFKVSRRTQTYTYRGQVEVDSVIIGKDLIYAVESKHFDRINSGEGIFKFQIAYSMATLNELLETSSRGVLALRIGSGKFYIVFLKPVIGREDIMIVNDLDIEKVYEITL